MRRIFRIKAPYVRKLQAPLFSFFAPIAHTFVDTFDQSIILPNETKRFQQAEVYSADFVGNSFELKVLAKQTAFTHLIKTSRIISWAALITLLAFLNALH